MTFGKKDLLSLFSLAGFLFCAASCTVESPGIPVKTYREPAVVVAAAQKEQQVMAQAIDQMSQVTENAVFTEKAGFPEYKVGPLDVLSIIYWTPSRDEGFKQNNYMTTVRPDGKISFIFGDDIVAGGRTTREIDDALTELARKYMRDPRIEVIVKEYKSRSALLAGQININAYMQGQNGPGRYYLNGKTRVLDLISTAGGIITGKTEGNGDLRRVELVRKGKRYTLNIYNAMFRGDLVDNVVLDDGDVVTVPELPIYAERVYVFGQVNQQGVRRLREAHDLLNAIAISGGTTPIAIKTDIKIIREYVERKGQPVILSANLDQILYQGDLSQNISLKDGDVIYVPRRVIGDINEFIANITPSLDFLLTRPPQFRTNYMLDQNAMRW